MSTDNRNSMPGRRAFIAAAAAGIASMAGARALGALERVTPRPARESPPFRMAVLGDSIMWGQGLADEEKFWWQTRKWLAHELRVPIEYHFLAHSGARIQPYPYLDTQPALYGEIPNPAPSVVRQAQLVPNPATIDFVLLDGGANDVGLMNALSPERDAAWIALNLKTKCGERMQAMLCYLVGLFPNARFAVTGYYPLVSAESFAAPNLLAALFQQYYGMGALAAQAYIAARDTLLEKSYAFANESTSALQDAVARTNALFPGRVVFAKPAIDGDRCFGASNSHIWGLLENDPVAAKRVAACHATGRLTLLDLETMQPGWDFDIVCPVASVMHPNQKGSMRYFEALTAVLPEFLPAWKARA